MAGTTTEKERDEGEPRWQLLAAAAPAMRAYGGEFVVHHALSNDTYRLSANAGAVLSTFLAADGESACESGLRFPDDPDVESTLQALAELGFVTRC